MSWIRFSVSYGEGFICLYMPVTKLIAADEWGHYTVYWLRRWCVQPTEHQWPTPNSPLTNWKPFLASGAAEPATLGLRFAGAEALRTIPPVPSSCRKLRWSWWLIFSVRSASSPVLLDVQAGPHRQRRSRRWRHLNRSKRRSRWTFHGREIISTNGRQTTLTKMVHPSHGFAGCCWDDDSIGCRSSRIPKRRDNETVPCWESKVMKSAIAVILLLLPIQAVAETKEQNLVRTPTTYKECIQRASDINSKWIEYQSDVNQCRTQFGVPGVYWASCRNIAFVSGSLWRNFATPCST